jgi:hypothetical protein
MLAPAATIKDDALNGHLFGMKYDTYNMPESMPVRNLLGEYFDTGNLYMRTARTLPIYDTTSQFTGPVLIMHGTADAAVGIIGSQRYKDAMPNVELELIEGEGHGFDNSLDYVAQKAVDFLLQKG